MLAIIISKLYNKYSKGSDSMIKLSMKNCAKNPIWGGVYLTIL